MNSIIFKEQKIWRKDFENGSAYSISISSRNTDGTFINAYMPVKFAQSAGITEKIHNGTVMDIEGFITAKRTKDGKGEPMIMVLRANYAENQDLPAAEDISEVDGFEMAAEDIPF